MTDEKPGRCGGVIVTLLFFAAIVCGTFSIVGGLVLGETGAVVTGVLLLITGGVSLVLRRMSRLSGKEDQ